MCLIPKVDIPEMKQGKWEIKKEEKKELSARDIYQQMQGRRVAPPGTYTILYKDGTIVMSDTPDEMFDHQEFVDKAEGNILIAGLGLGMVLQAVCLKEEVKHVTVVEIDPDLINMVGPHYKKKFGDKFHIIWADIFSWVPPKDAYYDFAWYDIWNTLCRDNIESMKKLHRKFGKKTGWQGSWGREYCQEK